VVTKESLQTRLKGVARGSAQVTVPKAVVEALTPNRKALAIELNKANSVLVALRSGKAKKDAQSGNKEGATATFTFEELAGNGNAAEGEGSAGEVMYAKGDLVFIVFEVQSRAHPIAAGRVSCVMANFAEVEVCAVVNKGNGLVLADNEHFTSWTDVQVKLDAHYTKGCKLYSGKADFVIVTDLPFSMLRKVPSEVRYSMHHLSFFLHLDVEHTRCRTKS